METISVEVDGVRSTVTDIGPRSDEAVVFLHGNPGSRDDWTALATEVSGFVRAVAPDMPGFGTADKPPDFDYSVPGYARHLGGLIDTLGIRRVHLVLHDFGGPWGLAFAVQRPEQVASVTLINIGVLRGYRWHAAALIWRTPLLGELAMALTTRAAFRALVRRGEPRGLPPAFVDGMYDHFDERTRRAVLRLYRSTSALDRFSDLVTSTLGGRRLPVLVVWGAQDPYVPVRYAQQQKTAFEAAQIHILDDSGHWPHQDNPTAVAALFVPFIRQALNR